MKFRTKTSMEAASVQEVMTASQQGSLLPTTIHGVTYGTPMSATREPHDETLALDRILLLAASATLAVGLATLLGVWCCVRRRRSKRGSDLNQSLLG